MSDNDNAAISSEGQEAPKQSENSTKEMNDVGTVEQESPAVSPAVKRRRSKGTHKTVDEVALAEARAVCGEVDTTSGRQLRRREPPAEVKPKPEPVKRSRSKKEPAPKKSKTENEETEEKHEDKVDNSVEEPTSSDAAPKEEKPAAVPVSDEATAGKPTENKSDSTTAPTTAPSIAPSSSLPPAPEPSFTPAQDIIPLPLAVTEPTPAVSEPTPAATASEAAPVSSTQADSGAAVTATSE